MQGPVGAAGATGSAGVDGKTVRSGSGVPSSGLGVNGDFYINTTADTIYGPKTNGAWGSATSLIGPQGPQGPTIHTVAMCTGSYLASDDATGCATVCGGAAKVSAHGGAYCTAVPDTGVTCSQNLISGYGICCVCIP